MAIDNTPPRLKLIATIAVITVVTLVGIDFVLKSYYAMMTTQAQHEKLAPTRDRDEQRKAEQTALTGASLPIDQAMSQFAKGARPDSITPQPSEDLAPMTGWSKLPKVAPAPVAHAAPIDPAAAGDGGALATGDGGAAPMIAADAGATPTHGAPTHGAPDAAAPRRAPAPERGPRDGHGGRAPEPGQPAPPAPAPSPAPPTAPEQP